MSWHGPEATDELLREFFRTRPPARSVGAEKLTGRVLFSAGQLVNPGDLGGGLKRRRLLKLRTSFCARAQISPFC